MLYVHWFSQVTFRLGISTKSLNHSPNYSTHTTPTLNRTKKKDSYYFVEAKSIRISGGARTRSLWMTDNYAR